MFVAGSDSSSGDCVVGIPDALSKAWSIALRSHRRVPGIGGGMTPAATHFEKVAGVTPQ